MLVRDEESLDYKNAVIEVDAQIYGIPEKLDDFDVWYDTVGNDRGVLVSSYDRYYISIKVTGTFNDDGSPRGDCYSGYPFKTKSSEDAAIAKINEIFNVS